MTDIVIASAARTPVGAFNGGLASLAAHQLGEVAIVEALKRAQVEPKDVSQMMAAIGRLWNDDTLRQRLGAAARVHALERYSNEAVGRRLGQILDSLAGESGR